MSDLSFPGYSILESSSVILGIHVSIYACLAFFIMVMQSMRENMLWILCGLIGWWGLGSYAPLGWVCVVGFFADSNINDCGVYVVCDAIRQASACSRDFWIFLCCHILLGLHLWACCRFHADYPGRGHWDALLLSLPRMRYNEVCSLWGFFFFLASLC